MTASFELLLDATRHQRGRPTEGEHIPGQLVALACKHGVATPSLDLAHCHVAAYEAVRSRN
jgi:ketopantoate reductase